ncbi:MAG: DUF1574 domain-containing protein, partial [Sphaerospermopsis kisseleviana]
EKNQSQRTTFFTSNNNTTYSQFGNSAFNASAFTPADDTPSTNLPAAPLKQKANATAILLAARSNLPSFNARQLDEQFALYKQRLATDGKPPDVLIIGSSRALRGVDPVALSKALSTQGYPKVDVFNFGINGATAQVVEFIIRRVLQPSELPKMIIWADGSRAFNSDRKDITFNAIAASKGYEEVLKRATQPVNNNSSSQQANAVKDKLTKDTPVNVNTYQVTNDFLNQALVGISASYENRGQIKALLQKQLNYLPVINNSQQVNSKTELTSDTQEQNSQAAVDFDGFLPLSIRFNPAIYYQNHPRVAGAYDNDYKDFQLAGNQDTALKSMIEFTKNKKISLVFVNMPLTGDYLDPVRLKYEQ